MPTPQTFPELVGAVFGVSQAEHAAGVGEHKPYRVQVQVRGVTCCGLLERAQFDPDRGVLLGVVKTPQGPVWRPWHGIRACGSVDGRCTC